MKKILRRTFRKRKREMLERSVVKYANSIKNRTNSLETCISLTLNVSTGNPKSENTEMSIEGTPSEKIQKKLDLKKGTNKVEEKLKTRFRKLRDYWMTSKKITPPMFKLVRHGSETVIEKHDLSFKGYLADGKYDNINNVMGDLNGDDNDSVTNYPDLEIGMDL